MFCGFGAVVLLVMLLNREMLEVREVKQHGSREAVRRVSLKLQFAREDLESQSAHLAELEDELQAAATQQQALSARLDDERRRTAAIRREADDSREQLTSLVAEVGAAQQTRATLEAETEIPVDDGQRLIGFTGDGRRQYLTGLKLGGERTLILLDASASMLDETVVNIVRRKLGKASERRRAPKWLRTVRTVRWLVANIQRDKQFQIYAFDTTARAVVAGSDGRWLDANSSQTLKDAVAAVEELAPEKGTSLANAFAVIKSLVPRPDSVVLLTDGLPTHGRGRPTRNVISSAEREALFEQALSRLGTDIPLNTLLFPLEGDPAAAEAFWRLAIKTRGSFITPSRDWP